MKYYFWLGNESVDTKPESELPFEEVLEYLTKKIEAFRRIKYFYGIKVWQ